MASDIIFAVKKEYFDQILSGEKTEEYRLRNDYWTRRLLGRSYSGVIITLGYPPAGDLSRRLSFPWSGFVEKRISHPHFGPDPVDVFAILLTPLSQRVR